MHLRRLFIVFVSLFAMLECSCSKPSVTESRTAVEPAEFEAGLILDLDKVTGMIHDLCYGVNQPLIPEATLRRIGGNRMTGYNWEINASNSGNDANHSNDRWLNGLVGLGKNNRQPAAWIQKNIELHRAEKAVSLVTLPIAGYVVADGNGKSVGKREAAPSPRWVKVIPKKPKGELGAPDLRDRSIFADEEVTWLVSRFGSASDGGIKYYGLDNEPSLWSETHPRLHPEKATYQEVVSKAVATAAAVIDVDPEAQIVGPALYGWYAHVGLQKAADRNKFNKVHGNFSAFYLSEMAKASKEKGKRLLHIFDFHWYPEAQGGGMRVSLGDGENMVTPEVVEARIQSPRSLWDPSYVEDSWVTKTNSNQPVELIPRMQKIIEENYPGTRFGILEYNYGAGHHISGGLATADVLGIYGRYGVAGCLWAVRDDNDFEKAAFRLYLNYDGQGSRFCENSLEVPATAPEKESIYASRSQDKNRMTVVVLNKQADAALEKQIQFKHYQSEPAVRAFRFGPDQPQLELVTADLKPIAGGFAIKCPPHSATVVELKVQ